MKNIPHLEDLAFLANPAEIKELMAALIFNIQGHNVGELSIKYDGAPALVFGRDTNPLSFFVATKGYFNKTPLLYRSIDEIENSNLRQEVKDKLFMLLDIISKDYSLPPGITYFGDFLFMNGYGQSAKGSFQPNIIKYSSSYVDFSKYLMGIAIHGVEFCKARCSALKDSNPSDKIYTPNVNYIQYDDLGADKVNWGPYLNQKIFSPETLFDTADDKMNKAMRSYFNTIVKLEKQYDRKFIKTYKYQGFDNVEENLHNLIVFKYEVLARLRRGKHERYPLTMSISGEPSTHEGYVFRYKDQVVKLVDRFVFSKANFDQTTDRGWKK